MILFGATQQTCKVFAGNIIILVVDFPGGTAVKNPPANAGDTGSIPGPGISHMLQSD